MNRPVISVLMSIYNENAEEIVEAIESIQSQTFSSFELIIVLDNPKEKSLNEIAKKYKKNDYRIRIIENEKNIGLAMSMNKAAKIAKGKYLARMDADDISCSDRLEKEYKILSSGKYDLVCSRYEYIDEKSDSIMDMNKTSNYYDSNYIYQKLPIKSVIHHPTVMFTKRIFDLVGGYRDFPCSQDYDLWLRFRNVKATFYMIDEILLKYRIRSSSISVKRKLQQQITIEYIRDLFIERLKNGSDSFSKENYKRYIYKYLKNEEKNMNDLIKGSKMLRKANEHIFGGKKIRGTVIKIYVFLTNPMYRHIYTKLIFCMYKINNLSNKK